VRCQRGSAFIWITVMIISITAVVLVCATFGMANIRYQIRAEDQQSVNYAFEGICSTIDDDANKGIGTLPKTYNVNQNGVSGTITVSDNSASMANTLLVSGTLTSADGRTYPVSQIIAKGHKVSPFDYALWVNATFTATKAIITGSSGSNGDTYIAGTGTYAAGSTVNGNLSVLTIATGMTVTGTYTPAAPLPCTWPVPLATNYSANATTTYASSQTLTNYTFPTVTSGQPYPLVYVNGNLTISGTITNIGTFYVTGTISLGNLTYANASARVAFISPLGLSLGSNCVGYIFSGGTVTFAGGPAGITLSRGGIYGSAISTSRNITIVGDPAIKNNSNEGTLMHLPGLWP